MNPLLETLNVWADHALRFAWPMLWQSSLLIGVLFALDLILKKQARAAVRYALWLVVVVKVLLPPSLAFPTSPSWWLRPAQVAPVNPRPAPVVVTYITDDQPTPLTAGTPVLMTPYRPRLSPSGWALIVTATVSLGLFAWMLVRWYQVARDARRAATAPAWLWDLLPECQRPACIRLTDHPQSPAVCGLFRPMILLPRSLADQLPPAQLRAVLLHELVHLRRGDVWANCLQALVQILYWWHPLLWLANARIRRVREEAVDDAVMLALDTEADTYAPTLLEVAKLSLHRPLASLGLVGILESRSALSQRIERLLDFHPPRKAGLTLGAALAVLAFAAVAVPMGEAPAPLHETRSGPLSLSLSPSEGERVPKAGEGLVHAPSAWQEALAAAQVSPSAESQVLTNGSVSDGLSSPSQSRQAILTKLDRIRFDSVSFNGLPLSEVVRFLVEESKKRDPEKRGVNFLVNQDVDSGSSGTPAATPLGPDGQLVPATATEPVDMSAVAVKINPALTNIRLADLLDAIVMVADQPIKYAIEENAIVFSPRRREATPLYVRTFKVDPDTFLAGLGAVTGTAWGNGPLEVAPALVNFLATAGVHLDPTKNPGKALFWNDRQSMLLVRGTMEDLDIVEREIAALGVPLGAPPAPRAVPELPESQVVTNGSVFDDSSSPGLRLDRKLKINTLVRDGKLLYEMGRTIAAEAKLKEALKLDPQNQAAAYYLKLLSQHRANKLVDDGKRLYEQGWLEEAELYLEQALKEDPQDIRANHYLKLVREALHKTTGGLRKALLSPNPYSRTNLVHTGQGRQAIIAKLDSIRLDRVTFDGLSLREVVQTLAGEVRKRDPEKRGVDLLVILDPTPDDIGAMPIKISPPLTNIRLRDVLDAIVKAADRPIKYSIEDYAIVFAPKARETIDLYSRMYEVDTNALVTNGSLSNGLSNPGREKIKASTLVHDGKLLYEMDKLDEAEAKLKAAIREDPHNEAALYYLNLVSEAKYIRAAKLHRDLTITNPYARTTLVDAGPGRGTIITNLDRIRLDRVSFDGQPLSEVVRFLNDESKKRDPEGRGVGFLLNGIDLSSLPITIKPPLTNIRLADVLDAIVKRGGWPIKYGVGDYGVTFSAKTGPEAGGLCIRTFKVNANALIEGLRLAEAGAVTKGSEPVAGALRDYLAREGVDLEPSKNPGKSLLFDERQGVLMIVATWLDLGVIERALRTLNAVPPQINFKCKFVEASEDDLKAVGFDLWGKRWGNAGVNGREASSIDASKSAPSPTQMTILNEPQVNMFIRALEQRPGAQLLAQPEVTVSSGRQAQCKTTDTKKILTVIRPAALAPPGITSTNDDESSVYAIEPLDIGPSLDVVPSVLEDGYTVSMRVIAQVLEFFGYAGYQTNSVAVYVNGKKKWVSPPSPDFRIRQMVATTSVRDGETLVLSNPELMVGNTSPVVAEKPGDGRKRLIVLVTPTLIDSTGKRVHPPDETPLPGARTPPQPAR